MPSNYLHLGLISLLFPNAKIIHCRRQPLDVAISCYAQYFSPTQPLTNSLDSIGRCYVAYEKLMAHWAEMLPGKILDVQYEDVVKDINSSAQTMLDHLGLDWEDACLEFHKTERTSYSASSWQVRQPLYQSSVGRWRNYEQHLSGLKDTLGSAFFKIG